MQYSIPTRAQLCRVSWEPLPCIAVGMPAESQILGLSLYPSKISQKRKVSILVIDTWLVFSKSKSGLLLLKTELHHILFSWKKLQFMHMHVCVFIHVVCFCASAYVCEHICVCSIQVLKVILHVVGLSVSPLLKCN